MNRLSLLVALVGVIGLVSPAGAATFSRKPYAQAATATSVVLKWRQSSGAATIFFGPKGAAMQQQAVSSGQDQEVTLQNLTGATRYAYIVDVGGGNTAAGEFTTAVKASDPFTFIAYGDNRTEAADHQAVVDAMAKEGVDFLVNTGDVVDYPFANDFDNFFKIEEKLLAQNVLFTALGNHEFAIGLGTNQWLKEFALPTASSGTERYYDFDWGNSKFIVLDFNSMTNAQKTWLQKSLTDAQTKGAQHIFVFMHHSPYDSGNHGENTAAQNDWVPLFTQFKVDLLVGGHDHDYERGFNATTNLRYIITGGGGAPLYTANSMKPYQQKFSSVNHYVKISVSGPMVTVTAVQPDGTVVDTFSFGGGGPVMDMASSNSDGGVAPPVDMAAPTPQPDLIGYDLNGVDLLFVPTTADLTMGDMTKTGDLTGTSGAADMTTPSTGAPTGGCSCNVGDRGRSPASAAGLALLGLVALALVGRASRRR